MGRLLTHTHRPTGVFGANDAMAIGCMRQIKEAGLRIPEDVAIVGFDDIEMSALVEPRLTTVRVFKEELGRLALERLVEMIHAKSNKIVTTLVPVELVERESTKVRKEARLEPARAFGEEDVVEETEH
jgi:LacI family transcriptional regulator